MYASNLMGVGRLVVIAVSLVTASVVTAQTTPAAAAPVVQAPTTPPPPVSMRTSEAANQIAEINERMSVMQAQLAKLELQAKIAAKNDEIRRFGRLPETGDESLSPTVTEISGIDGRLTANLLVASGNIQTVRVGDQVGGWTVRSISIDSLTIARGKETKRLSFGSYVQNFQAPAGTSGAMSLPGAMPLPR